MNVPIDRARREDLPGIFGLLRTSGLPAEGLEGHVATTLVARVGPDEPVGSAALELCGADALLRSVAVRADRRGSGLGRRLVGAALQLARQHGVSRVYLLTETADGYFPRFGFRPVGRREVPPRVRCSVEFVSACPESARAMAADLLEKEA